MNTTAVLYCSPQLYISAIIAFVKKQPDDQSFSINTTSFLDSCMLAWRRLLTTRSQLLRVMSSRNGSTSRSSSQLPLKSPESYAEDPPELTNEQLELPSVELYAQTPLHGSGPSDEANFTGKFRSM